MHSLLYIQLLPSFTMLKNLARVTRVRHFSAYRPMAAAQVFKMPAMSPTMTEGGIVSWKVKPGDLFAAGDVLLEVETDKATIDVEAQDDGVMWQVLEQDGASGVPVGKPIAFLAEPGDDLASLEAPQVETAPKETKKDEKPAKAAKEAEPASKAKTETKPEPSQTSEQAPKNDGASTTSGSDSVFAAANPKLKLFPSVELMLQTHGISDSEAYSKIPASGPQGRILLGDVLAYVGEIKTLAVEKVTKYIHSKEHLDLSNIQIAPPAAKAEEPKPQDAAKTGPLTYFLTLELETEEPMSELMQAFHALLQDSKPGHLYRQATSLEESNSDFFDDLLEPLESSRIFSTRDAEVTLSLKGLPDLEVLDEDDTYVLLGMEDEKPAAVPEEDGPKIATFRVTLEFDHFTPEARELAISYCKDLLESLMFELGTDDEVICSVDRAI